MKMKFQIIFLSLFISTALSFSTGPGTCFSNAAIMSDSLMGGPDVNDGVPKFAIVVPDEYVADMPFSVGVQSLSTNDNVNGLLLYAENSLGERVGEFTAHSDFQLICSQEGGSTIGHDRSSNKGQNLEFNFVPSEVGGNGELTFYATVVKHYDTFRNSDWYILDPQVVSAIAPLSFDLSWDVEPRKYKGGHAFRWNFPLSSEEPGLEYLVQYATNPSNPNWKQLKTTTKNFVVLAPGTIPVGLKVWVRVRAQAETGNGGFLLSRTAMVGY